MKEEEEEDKNSNKKKNGVYWQTLQVLWRKYNLLFWMFPGNARSSFWKS